MYLYTHLSEFSLFSDHAIVVKKIFCNSLFLFERCLRNEI